MKYKTIITFSLFIFSFLLIKSGVYIIRENDPLMKTLKEKQSIYNIKPIDAIITENIIIPGINGKTINYKKSYKKMKSVNSFQESLLVFDEIKPNKSIKNIYNKVIVSGNPYNNNISILTKLDNKYCYTKTLTIKKECILNSQYTILIHEINHNHLTQIKDNLQNGKIFYLRSINNEELRIIIKYIKNNNYEIVSIDNLIQE